MRSKPIDRRHLPTAGTASRRTIDALGRYFNGVVDVIDRLRVER